MPLTTKARASHAVGSMDCRSLESHKGRTTSFLADLCINTIIAPPPNDLPNFFSENTFNEDMVIRLNVAIAQWARDYRNINASRREIEAMR
ncbi:hypothetical protein Tco_0963967, partial [Tanacetum coccineum]